MSYGEKQEYKRMVWQYLCDHSLVQKDGYRRILFYIKDREDFDRRVQYRLRGFKRNEDEYLIEVQNKIIEKVKAMERAKWYSDMLNKKKDEIVKEIEASWKLHKKIILWLHRKTKNYLFSHIQDAPR